MSKYSKRRRIIISTIFAIVIWVSLNIILIKVQESQRKKIISNAIVQTNQIIQNEKENEPKNEEDDEEVKKQNTETKNVEIESKSNEIAIITNQYKNNKWRIIIPKINLDAPILEGTEKEVLRRGVGHFKQTETWNGNVALAAHNRGYKYNFFQEIRNLEIGDTIKYQTKQGVRNYEVAKNTIIKETDLSCLERTKENKLTLITCEKDMPEYRRCIEAYENFAI